MVMLENNGCPPEQLFTLKNTVKNQEVKPMSAEEFDIQMCKFARPSFFCNNVKPALYAPINLIIPFVVFFYKKK